MRALVILAVGACSHPSETTPPDAFVAAGVCAAAPPQFVWPCVDAGIAGDVLDGTVS